MRLILTGLAAAVVLALTAALVGPHLIDWNAHRPALEARLSEALGVPARLAAPIEMTLLPAPRLSAGGLSLGSGEGGAPRLEAGTARFELSAPSLTRGEWRFVEARLDAPTLTLTLDKEGRLIAPAGARVAASIEAARIAGGALIVKDAGGGERLRLENIELAFSAEGLAGPFKGQGKAGARGLGFRFATGAVQAGKMRLKLALDAGGATPRAEFDGTAQLSGAPGYEGQFFSDGAFALDGGEPTPWRMTATLKADANGATFDPLDLKIGAEERPLGVSGRASLDGEGARLTLAARQIDLDKALGADGKPATPRQAFAAAFALARRAADAAGALSGLPLSVELTPGVVTLGGETIPDAALALTRAPGAAPQIRIDASLPGRTRVKAAGALDGGAAARFRGRIDASTFDARRLRDWLGDLLPPNAQPPFSAMSASAAAEISAVSLSLREGRMKLDRTPLAGEIIYVAPVAGERGRLFADLSSDALDIDGAPDLTALVAAAPDHDFSIVFDARAVRVARFGEGTLDAGRILFAARREGGRTELERLSLAGVGGADLKAQGALDAQGGTFSLDLDAQRLGDLASLIERLAPGRFSAALKARAARLSPARLTVKAQAGPDFALREASASGVFAGTRADGRAGPAAGGGIAAHVEIAQDDVVTLLRQIGFDTRGPPRLGAARIVADMTTQPGGLAQASLRAQAPGATLGYEGGFLLPALLAGAPQALGVVSLDAENVAPLLTAAGVLAPGGFAKGGADVAAQVATTGDGLAFEALRGWAFGTRVSGAAGLVVGGRGRIEGRLAMERLALADVAALALGFSADAPAKSPWSDRAFAPAIGADAPDVAMAINAERLDTGIAGETGPARATLTLTPGAARLDGLDAPLMGGRLAASLGWRRDGLDASFSGKIGVSGLTLDGAAASGSLDASLEAAGSGRNVAALVAALGGEGSARISGLTLKRAAPGALAAAVKGVEGETISLELGSLERALAARLDAGDRRASGPVETALTLATGVARAAPVALDAAQERLAASAALDLRSMTLEIREAVAAKAAPTHWAGSPPAFEAIWRGPVGGAMERGIEAGALLNGLSARSLALELERVEALEADIAERAMFARRQKAWEFMRRREREIAEYEAEQARLEEIRRAEAARREQARRAEEARRALEAQRAEEERRAEEARKAEEARRAEERRRIEEERRAEATRREMQRALDALRIDAPLAGEPPPKGEAPLDAPR